MKRLIISSPALLFLTLAQFCAHANLGENLSQIEQRYGLPVGEAGNPARFILEFSFHGYRVLVTFSAADISVIEGFSKQNGQQLSDPEIGAILSENSLNSRWVPLSNYQFKAWRLASNAAQAAYLRGKLTLGTEFNIDGYLNYLKATNLNHNTF